MFRICLPWLLAGVKRCNEAVHAAKGPLYNPDPRQLLVGIGPHREELRWAHCWLA
jgi:hypothetical protein